jgi:hypothetical protein
MRSACSISQRVEAAEAWFPRSPEEFLWVVVAYVAEQVRVAPESSTATDSMEDRTIEYHRAQHQAIRPSHDRFGISVGPTGQSVWLDEPGQPVLMP